MSKKSEPRTIDVLKVRVLDYRPSPVATDEYASDSWKLDLDGLVCWVEVWSAGVSDGVQFYNEEYESVLVPEPVFALLVGGEKIEEEDAFGWLQEHLLAQVSREYEKLLAPFVATVKAMVFPATVEAVV